MPSVSGNFRLIILMSRIDGGSSIGFAYPGGNVPFIPNPRKDRDVQVGRGFLVSSLNPSIGYKLSITACAGLFQQCLSTVGHCITSDDLLGLLGLTEL